MICSVLKLIPTEPVFVAPIVEVNTKLEQLDVYRYRGNFVVEVKGVIPNTYQRILLDGIPIEKVVSPVRHFCFFEFKQGSLHKITFFNFPLDAFRNRIPVVTIGP